MSSTSTSGDCGECSGVVEVCNVGDGNSTMGEVMSMAVRGESGTNCRIREPGVGRSKREMDRAGCSKSGFFSGWSSAERSDWRVGSKALLVDVVQSVVSANGDAEVEEGRSCRTRFFR